MTVLHRYHDGSVLRVITSRELIRLPIWKGQRILDPARVSEMKRAIDTNVHRLDSGYHIVRYREEAADGRLVLSAYLIDGQHRAAVLSDFYASALFEPEFDVTVTEKTVESEADAIEHFNNINNVKVQQWAVDPNLLINSYICAIERAYNKPKLKLIRPGATTRPYLSSDALRAALLAQQRLVKGGDAVERFVTASEAYNTKLVHQLGIELLHSITSKDKRKSRVIKANFALAYDENMDWVRVLLESATQ